MRKMLCLKLVRVVAVFMASVASAQAGVASEAPAKAGQVRYTTGTATVQKGPAPRSRVVISDGVPSQDSGPWRVAGVDASAIADQASMVAIKPVTFELPSAAAFQTESVVAGPVVSSAEATRSKEPGFWAPALSTLALALFFFLRRLA